MGISSAGIGSGLDVDSIVKKLMSAEQGPVDRLDKQAAANQARLNAFGKLSSALGAFQGSLSALGNSSTFSAQSVKAGNDSVLTGTATSKATAGTYNIRVSQLAQAQSLTSRGFASTSALVGTGIKSTLTFSWGTVGGGRFGTDGIALPASTASTGITPGSLSINGTVIGTTSSTRTARQLADAINEKSSTTGVTADAVGGSSSATLFGASGATTFGNVDTGAGGDYQLSVNGIMIAFQGTGVPAGSGVTAASIDAALTGTNPLTNALAAANITFSGHASDGTLKFTAADGSNLTISETVSGSVTGGIQNSGTANAGRTETSNGHVTLTSASGSPITIGGTAPNAAGLTAGTGGSYLGSTFTQDGTQSRGSVVLDAGDQSLQGIRDAINKANIGVTASIISDGSAAPYHLVLTSKASGATSTMKVEISDENGAPGGDLQLAGLLGYDPAGAQNLSQTSAAQSTVLNVNGLEVTSKSLNVGEAIQGVNLSVAGLGTTTVTVSKDTKSITDSVNAFVKAYNDLNTTIKGLTLYDSDTKSAGALQGDATVRGIQSELRNQLGAAITDSGAQLTSLSQVGIEFQKDGSLSVNSSKLNKAISEHYNDFANLFAAIGTTTNSQVEFLSATKATKPGTYAVNITQPATKGNLTSSAALGATTTIGADTTWTVTLDQTDPVTTDRIQTISIKAGSYTPRELAALISSSINGNTKFAGAGIAVESEIDAAGKLSLSSSRWGAGSKISIVSSTGTPVSNVFGGAVPTAGLDVAGTIGGAAATGNGQTLTAAAGSKAEGLKLTVTGSTAGDYGSITFSQGFAYQLTNLAGSFIGKGGMVTDRTDGLNTVNKNISKQRETATDRLADLEKRYRAQFTALDTMMSSLQSTQQFLTQQLASLSANR